MDLIRALYRDVFFCLVRLEVADRQSICDIMSKPGSNADSLFFTVSFIIQVLRRLIIIKCFQTSQLTVVSFYLLARRSFSSRVAIT